MINDGFINFYSKMTKNDTWEVQQKVNQNLSALKNLSFEELIFTPDGEIVGEKKFLADLQNQKVTYLQNEPQLNTPEQKIKDIAVFLKFVDGFPGGVNHEDVMLVKEKLDSLHLKLKLTQPLIIDLSKAQIALNDLANKTTKPISEPKIDPENINGLRFSHLIPSHIAKQIRPLYEKIDKVTDAIKENEVRAKEEVSSKAKTIGLFAWGSWISIGAFPLIGLSVPVLAPLIFLAIPAFFLSIGLFIAYVIVDGKTRFENSELNKELQNLINDRNQLKSEKIVFEAIDNDESLEKFIPFCNQYEISSIREALEDPGKAKKLFLIFASEDTSGIIQGRIEDKNRITTNLMDRAFVPTSVIPSAEEIEQYRKDLNLV